MSVFKSLNLSCRISKYFGIFPFNLGPDGSLKISIFWLIWSHILLASLTAGAIWISYKDTSITVYDKHFLKDLFFVTVLTSSKNITALSFLALHTIWLMINRKKLESTFKLLITTDGIVPKLSSRWPRIITYTVVLSIILIEILPVWRSAIIVTDTLVNLMPSGLQFTALYQFTDLLQVCRCHFRKRKSTFGELQLSEEIITTESRKSALLEQCKRNNELIVCCETLSYCFGHLLLLAVVNCFAEFSTLLFLKFHFRYDFLHFHTLLFGVWLSLFVYTFRYLLASCENTVLAANEFYDNLAETLLNCDDLSNEPCFTVTLLSRKSLKFSAFGYITMDYGLFFSVFAAAITYFLVFIEFNTLMKAQLKDREC